MDVPSVISPQLRRLLSYVRPYLFRLLIGVVLLAIVAFTEGLVALMVKPAFDQVLKPGVFGSSVPLVTLPWSGRVIYLNNFFPASIHNVGTIFALAFLFIGAVRSLAEYLGATQIQYVGHAAVTDLRNAVFSRIILQPIGFFQKNSTGRLISAAINDVERTRVALSEYLADLFQKSFTFLAFVSVLLLLNWKMALGAAVLLPLVLLPVNKFGRKIRRSAENTQIRLADLSQILQETTSGNRIVKAFGMEDFEIHKFAQIARRLLKESMRWVRAAAITSPLMDLLGALIIPLLLLYARGLISHHQMTEGQFLAFMYAMFSAYGPVKRMGYVYQQFQAAQGASLQIFSFLDLPVEVADAPGSHSLGRFAGEIVFENVAFAYESAPILREISFTARKGEVIALVGTSGAGKTTLVNLIPRFHDVTSGSLRLDGRDVRDISLRSLRSQIAMVTQENILFHDTVWNNICYGQSNVTEEQVHAAARAALAADFIAELPQGYFTMIGERGQRLSGGQRQRIAIARAILKDSPILILDEATSELDAESERLVQQALANLMTGRTSFVIAHRLSTIRRADRILVLDGGLIRESGSHADLLARGGLYARLCDLQFADDETLAPSPDQRNGLTEPSTAT
jgi:subfamily B ATP-binding cassette protein MsbA